MKMNATEAAKLAVEALRGKGLNNIADVVEEALLPLKPEPAVPALVLLRQYLEHKGRCPGGLYEREERRIWMREMGRIQHEMRRTLQANEGREDAAEVIRALVKAYDVGQRATPTSAIGRARRWLEQEAA